MEEELKQAYFAFYDKLPEPYCSQAKENWTYNVARYTPEVDSPETAIVKGFSIIQNPQGQDYWNGFLSKWFKGDFDE